LGQGEIFEIVIKISTHNGMQLIRMFITFVNAVNIESFWGSGVLRRPCINCIPPDLHSV